MLSSDFPTDRLARQRYMTRERDMREGVLTTLTEAGGAVIHPGKELSRGSFSVKITISKDSRKDFDDLKEKMRKMGFRILEKASSREFKVMVKAVDARQAQKKTSDALVKARAAQKGKGKPFSAARLRREPELMMGEAKDVPTVRLNARGGNAVVLAWGDDRGAKKFANRSQADKAAATVGGKVIKPGRVFYVMIGENLDEAKKVPLRTAAEDVVDDLARFVRAAQLKGPFVRPKGPGPDKRLEKLKLAIKKGDKSLLLTAAKDVMDDLERYNRSTQGPGRQRMASLKAAITRSILGEGFHDKHPMGAPFPPFLQISDMSGAPKPFFLDRVKEFIGRKTKRESIGKFKTRKEAEAAAKKVAARTKEKIK